MNKTKISSCSKKANASGFNYQRSVGFLLLQQNKNRFKNQQKEKREYKKIGEKNPKSFLVKCYATTLKGEEFFRKQCIQCKSVKEDQRPGEMVDLVIEHSEGWDVSRNKPKGAGKQVTGQDVQ